MSLKTRIKAIINNGGCFFRVINSQTAFLNAKVLRAKCANTDIIINQRVM